ncbi:DUF4352 domain-containing protein [Candidatus Micrarchaeota archaeon]|jgi:hypothetical protein|nr:DUF4352 domain-containing protein [Candidatus Micrarchaeota archaeon]
MAEQEIAPKKKLGTGAKIAIGCGGITLLGIIIFVIITIAGIAGVAKVADNVDKAQKDREASEQEAFDNPYQIGEEVVVNDVQWIVTEAQNLGSTLKSKYGSFGDNCVANSGTFVKVIVKIKNNSSQMVSVSNLYLYDSQKREFITSSNVFGCIEDDLFILDNINPGIEKTFVAVYEIPDGAESLRLKVGNLDLFTEGHKYVSLGL